MKNLKPFITGIVVAAGWDDNGNVALISIQGYDEKEYIVKMNRCGKELMDFINRKVMVSGNISDRVDGKHFIQVNQYDLIWGNDILLDLKANIMFFKVFFPYRHYLVMRLCNWRAEAGLLCGMVYSALVSWHQLFEVLSLEAL